MKAPFIYFGGKRRVAHVVWEGLGDCASYVEPFAGSLAVLLERPTWHEAARTETVNDKDAFIANFWRALSAAPDEVATHADWPVNETDLFARHLWLVQKGSHGLAERLDVDPEWFDSKVAGWWVWGINQWIGSGWCSGDGPWSVQDGSVANREGQTVADRGAGVSPGRPHLGRPGGVNRQLPNLGDAGRGVNRQLPNLGNAGRGSHARDFDAGGAGQARNEWDKSLCLDGEAPIRGYLRALAARIRRVRVCCGDWSRIVTDGALSYGSTVGVFLDPPYLGTERTKGCYAVDDYTISNEVREWALAHGDDKRLRIVLAGYVPEHEEHMPATWRRHAYSAGASYQTAAGARGEGNGQNRENRHKECLWFSPGCLKPARTLDLFG